MNETEIPTPRTGSQLHYPHATGDGIINLVEGDFARQLERENAAMREVIKAAHNAIEVQIHVRGTGDDTVVVLNQLQSASELLKPYLP